MPCASFHFFLHIWLWIPPAGLVLKSTHTFLIFISSRSACTMLYYVTNPKDLSLWIVTLIYHKWTKDCKKIKRLVSCEEKINSQSFLWLCTVACSLHGALTVFITSGCPIMLWIWKDSKTVRQTKKLIVPMDVSGVMSSKKYWVASKAESGSSCSWMTSGGKKTNKLCIYFTVELIILRHRHEYLKQAIQRSLIRIFIIIVMGTTNLMCSPVIVTKKICLHVNSPGNTCIL